MISELAGAAGCLLVGLGFFGVASSKNTLRQIISLEVAFNGVVLLVASLMLGEPLAATLLLVLLAAIATNETIVLVILALAYWRRGGPSERASG